jgi:hypothetical protein
LTDYLQTPEKYVIKHATVTSKTKLTLLMKEAGGFAVSILD